MSPTDPLLARLAAATDGEYRVVRELGRGGTAATYLAWDLARARYVALKALFPEPAAQPGTAERFLRDADVVAGLGDHPNIARVYRARVVGELRYLVTAFVDGCSLEQLLRATGPLPIGVACHVLDQVALALQHAHERGVLHDDLTPANVMLDRRGAVVVTDFGLARASASEELTGTGVLVGNPAYASPERWTSNAVTPASDQYSLGVVAYRMLAGEPPFGGSAYQVQVGHLRATPRVVRAARPECPLLLQTIVSQMLEKSPDARWADAGKVHEALVPLVMAPGLAATLGALVAGVAPPKVGDGPPPEEPIRPVRPRPKEPAPAQRELREFAPPRWPPVGEAPPVVAPPSPLLSPLLSPPPAPALSSPVAHAASPLPGSAPAPMWGGAPASSRGGAAPMPATVPPLANTVLIPAAGRGRERPAPAPAPSAAEVTAAVDAFVAALRERRMDVLSRLAAAEGDAASAGDFLAWLASSTPRLQSVVPSPSPAVSGDRATVDLDVRWELPGLFARNPRNAARFRVVLARDGGAWRAQHVELRERFSPR